jgi:quinol-cytochrome oxidoreductase complex cytochrome b subunit
MLKALVLLFVFMGVTYFLFYPWLKHAVGRKQLFRWFLIIYGIAMLASFVGNYLLD